MPRKKIWTISWPKNWLNTKNSPPSKAKVGIDPGSIPAFLFVLIQTLNLKIEIMTKYLLIVLFSVCVQTICLSQEVNIKFKFKNVKDTTLYIAHRYADQVYIDDTIRIDKNGVAILKKAKAYAGGQYLVVLPKQKVFELLMVDDQKFTVETDSTNLIKNMKITGCLENEIMFDSQKFLQNKQSVSKNLMDRKEKYKDNADSTAKIQAEIDKIQDELNGEWKKLLQKYPSHLYSKILNAMNGDEGQFYDNFDFSDERLLRTEAIFRAIRLNIKKNLEAPVEKINEESDRMIQKATVNPKVYEYTVSYLLSFYNSFTKIGYNEVFVHLVENYVQKGKTPWFDTTAVAEINKRCKLMKGSSVGSKAAELDLESIDGNFIPLYQIDSHYTLLFFWSTGCGHCTAAAKAISEFYGDGGQDIEVYAVYTKNDKKAWQDFLKENNATKWINVWDPQNKSDYGIKYYVASTPICYLLDKDKNIIAKVAGDSGIKSMMTQLKEQKEKFKKK